MSREKNPSLGFRDIDASKIPDYYADHLRFQYEIPFFKEYKQKSFFWIDVQAGEKVLELGCGLGIDAEELAKLVGKTGKVFGIDSSASFISMAEEF